MPGYHVEKYFKRSLSKYFKDYMVYNQTVMNMLQCTFNLKSDFTIYDLGKNKPFYAVRNTIGSKYIYIVNI